MLIGKLTNISMWAMLAMLKLLVFLVVGYSYTQASKKRKTKINKGVFPFFIPRQLVVGLVWPAERTQ